MGDEYLGLWYEKCRDVDKWIGIVKEKCKGKPFMVTESGLCEPKFSGGDTKRIEIFKEREELYRKHNLSGWIYFSLNDYRTHMGEEGEGQYRQRVHGSTDIYGNAKPSLPILGEFLK